MKSNTQTQEDKRSSVRTPTEAIVTCQPFAGNGAMQAAEGIIRNFSSDGSYLETTQPYKCGIILFIRMLGFPAEFPNTIGDEQLRSICLAEVKWQQPIEKSSGTFYGTGVRYLIL